MTKKIAKNKDPKHNFKIILSYERDISKANNEIKKADKTESGTRLERISRRESIEKYRKHNESVKKLKTLNLINTFYNLNIRK